ncbi:MAG: hypothetical protein J7L07_11065 [Candidatus Odinarchaeota archaeon]|nr:hypothetical protein [Candidatus Odinarchaeota archaeon]
MKSLGEEEEVTLFMCWDRRKQEWFIVVGSGVGIKETKRYSMRWGSRQSFVQSKSLGFEQRREPCDTVSLCSYLGAYILALCGR